MSGHPQMRTVIASHSPEQSAAIGRALGELLQAGDVLLLSGDLGAGKTQLTKGIAAALGVREAITSPTFNIMYEYLGAGGIMLRHFDLYRLEDVLELEDIDYFGLLEDSAISVVEWGDKFPQALPGEFLQLSIRHVGEAGDEPAAVGGPATMSGYEAGDESVAAGEFVAGDEFAAPNASETTRELSLKASGRRYEQLLSELQLKLDKAIGVERDR